MDFVAIFVLRLSGLPREISDPLYTHWDSLADVSSFYFLYFDSRKHACNYHSCRKLALCGILHNALKMNSCFVERVGRRGIPLGQLWIFKTNK